MDGRRRTPDPWVSYKLTGEPFGSGELKRTNKGTDIHMWLILLYTVQPVIPDVCTKFQNPRSSSS